VPPTIAISGAVARRFLVLHHLLAPPRSLPAEPASVMRVVDRLGSVQFDPIDVTGRNHDLVLAARIDGYRREWTDRLLYEDRTLFEAPNKGLSLLPTAELPYYRVYWDRHRVTHETDTFKVHGALVDELLDRIRSTGPMSVTDVEPRAAIEWYWRPTNQVRAILEALAQAGILGLARRDGSRRVYDLVERLLPAEILAERRDERDQRRHKLLSRYRAHGLLGRTGSAELWLGTAPGTRATAAVAGLPSRAELLSDLVEAGTLVPVDVDGVRGERYVLEEELPILQQAELEVSANEPPGGNGVAPGVALLAPLDPLMWDRQLLRPLFSFDYVWEVYIPAAKRRWGYYVLPILFGDRLVGRIEPRNDRPSDALRISGLWWEEGFDPMREDGFEAAFAAALDAHRRFSGLRRVTVPRGVAHRPLAAALRVRMAANARA